MKRLVDRLRIQKQAASDWSFEQGREDGERWAIEDAAYSDLVELCGISPHERYIDGLEAVLWQAIPDGIEISEGALERADQESQAYVGDAYAEGFLNAAHEVWQKVAPEL